MEFDVPQRSNHANCNLPLSGMVQFIILLRILCDILCMAEGCHTDVLHHAVCMQLGAALLMKFCVL